MKTKIFNFKKVLLLVGLMIATTTAWAETIRTGWTLCTSASDITLGGTYIIAYSTSNTSFSAIHPMRNEYYGDADGSENSYIYAGSTSGASNSTTFNLSSGSSGDTSPYEVTIVAGSASGKIAIKLSNNKYIKFFGTGNNNVSLESNVTASSSFTPSFSSSLCTLTNVQYTSRKLQYNARFSNYSNQSNVYIYKKTVTCTLSSISLTTTGVQKTFCVGESFNYTGLVTTATYAGGCSNATVTPASVTVPSGAMNSAGDKTATVSYTEGGVTKTATYTITVQAKYTVTWVVDGDDTYVEGGDTQVCPGTHVSTLPTAPSTATYCGDIFVGWTDADGGNYTHGTSNLYKTASEFPNASGNQTFYAVFADYDE